MGRWWWCGVLEATLRWRTLPSRLMSSLLAKIRRDLTRLTVRGSAFTLHARPRVVQQRKHTLAIEQTRRRGEWVSPDTDGDDQAGVVC